MLKKILKPIAYILIGVCIGLLLTHNYINPNKVTNYVITDSGILLHTDNNGYYIEVPQGIE